jgi:hypothetical protein
VKPVPEVYGYTGAAASTRVGLYEPAGRYNSAVLIVPAIGDERRSLVRVEVELARRLASSGRLAVRLDPAGDPDSPLPAEERSVEALVRDVTAAFEQCRQTAPVFAVTLRTGSHLLAYSDIAEGLEGVIMIAPVSGADFVRDLFRRRGLRKMLTGGDGGRAESDETLDIDGVPFRQDFLEAFAAEKAPAAAGRRFAVLQIGPAGDATSATGKVVEKWLGAGALPALPDVPDVPDVPDELPVAITPGGLEPIAVWRHPILWGQTEYADITPLAEFVLRTLSFWERGNE